MARSDPCTTCARRDIDVHLDDIDARRRRMRLEVEQDERAQQPGVAHGRRQFQSPRVYGARGERQARTHDHGAAIGALERARERVAHARQHEGERLEPFDGPFEIEPLAKVARLGRGHERVDIVPAYGPMQSHARLAEPRVEIGTRQARHLTQRPQSPSSQGGNSIRGVEPPVIGARGSLAAGPGAAR